MKQAVTVLPRYSADLCNTQYSRNDKIKAVEPNDECENIAAPHEGLPVVSAPRRWQTQDLTNPIGNLIPNSSITLDCPGVSRANPKISRPNNIIQIAAAVFVS